MLPDAVGEPQRVRLEHLLEILARLARIEATEGIIEHENFRTHHQRTDESSTLAGVAVKAARKRVGDAGKLVSDGWMFLTAYNAERATGKLINQVPLSERPNNIAVAKDGKIIVGISRGPGALDIIDPVKLEVKKTIPTHGRLHNCYTSNDGNWATCGSVQTGVFTRTGIERIVRNLQRQGVSAPEPPGPLIAPSRSASASRGRRRGLRRDERDERLVRGHPWFSFVRASLYCVDEVAAIPSEERRSDRAGRPAARARRRRRRRPRG